MGNFDQEFLEIIQLTEQAAEKIKSLREQHVGDARALSIALTELETAQLWVANARPE